MRISRAAYCACSNHALKDLGGLLGAPRRNPQHGSASLAAACVEGRTALVRVRHAAPARLLPMQPAAIDRSGAAWCALGSFGGGLLGGDAVDLTLSVGCGASLALVTQASTKVYRTKRDCQPARQNLEANVAAGGLLVVAPDPLVPFADSSYAQRLRFCLESGEMPASIVVVDWLGSGRVATGERWAFRRYSSRAELFWKQDGVSQTERADLVESLVIEAGDEPNSMGPRGLDVAARLHKAAMRLASRSGARIRNGADLDDFQLPEISGKLTMGVTSGKQRQSDALTGSVTVARLMAEKSEDVYRVLHSCLDPLARELGVAPYSDRIHGHGLMPQVTGSWIAKEKEKKQTSTNPSTVLASSPQATCHNPQDYNAAALSFMQQMALCQLTDATLPTGGFAHSAGLEAADQLGLLGVRDAPDSYDKVKEFILSLARSNNRLHGTFVIGAHHLVSSAVVASEETESKLLERWQELDSMLHAHLATNEVASRASSHQGAGVARVARSWVGQQCMPRNGHTATVFGLLSAKLGLPVEVAVHAFAYCGVRDAVSAAVRLNLVGPLRAVELQSSILAELTHDLLRSSREVAFAKDFDGIRTLMESAAGCAPLVDVAQAAHDLLEARLFLT
eukprot:TRINITY_DN19144_c0_g1_i2.p1 TRINITY_DN19144_c0_g1~~TRINITY_DN19144_c0_g1_i2.p1  ORF type:complete len:623 (-),score=89.83 TRINITY_DN19144_c0_g1_i2:55-1923(-)